MHGAKNGEVRYLTRRRRVCRLPPWSSTRTAGPGQCTSGGGGGGAGVKFGKRGCQIRFTTGTCYIGVNNDLEITTMRL